LAITFTKERLILCEGSSDKTFFCELIKQRGLPEFQIQFPHEANETTGGIDKFGKFLLGNINEDFLRIVKGVLVVADNDDDHQTQFNRVRDQLRFAGYGVPDRVLKFVKSPNSLPPIAIMMLPLGGIPGNLETVFMQAALNKWGNLQQPLADYLRGTPVELDNWSIGKKDKARIQCILAATCQQNPYSTIATLYRNSAQYCVPLDVPCLNDIAQELANFDSLLQAA
jgi:hypothetical protein